MSEKYLYANFEFCNFCNQDCKMCIISNYKKHGLKKRFLSFENWDRGINSLSKFEDEIVNVSPHWIGEPLLHPRFGEYIEHAFKKNDGNKLFNHFTFSTNGVLLDRHLSSIMRCVDMKNQNPDTFYFVNFSIDAYSNETYMRIRGHDQLDLVKRNILLLLEEESKRGVNYPKVHLSFVVMEDNFREAQGFLDFWRDTFSKFGFPFEIDFKWPVGDVNAIYFRRLSDPNQDKANKLHLQTIKGLGLLETFKGPSELITKGEF